MALSKTRVKRISIEIMNTILLLESDTGQHVRCPDCIYPSVVNPVCYQLEIVGWTAKRTLVPSIHVQDPISARYTLKEQVRKFPCGAFACAHCHISYTLHLFNIALLLECNPPYTCKGLMCPGCVSAVINERYGINWRADIFNQTMDLQVTPYCIELCDACTRCVHHMGTRCQDMKNTVTEFINVTRNAAFINVKFDTQDIEKEIASYLRVRRVARRWKRLVSKRRIMRFLMVHRRLGNPLVLDCVEIMCGMLQL